MAKHPRKYIYISNLNYDGTVYQTQVLDWLHLFNKYDIEFDLIQAFHIKELKNTGFINQQLKEIKRNTKNFRGHIYLLPSKSIFYFFNTIIIFFRFLRLFLKYNEVLIFSRTLIGKEIAWLRKILPFKIIFFFDARAASAEENKYIAKKEGNFKLKKYKTIANIYFLEYKTLTSADKVFSVSKALQKYFKQTYNINDDKFVSYPCLSDPEKFYFSPALRIETRNNLKIDECTKVFVYSGGIGSSWHVTLSMVLFFDQLFKYEENFLFLCLTREKDQVTKMLVEFPEIISKCISFSVQNDEVCKYLNAADYGILFRENTIMNNVASPTKFAEYILCGLPVLISEGVGDYSKYTIDNDLGVLITEDILKFPVDFSFKDFLEKKFNREYISEIGKRSFSKDSIINTLVYELKSGK